MRTCLALTSVLGGALLAATVTVPAASAASAPVARDDSYSTAANTNLVIGASGVLGNDTDADGDPLAASLLAGAQHGNVSVAGNGAFTYVPTTNYVGPDQFTYQACEVLAPAVLQARQLAAPGCDTATVFITVRGTTPTTTPAPTTTTEPPPVGIPAQFGNCAQAVRFGFHDIPSTNPRYRLILDRDRDGIACEVNEGPAPVTVVRPPVPGNTTIVNPPAPPSGPNTVVIVPPAPSGSNYSQIGQAPSGYAQTGFGPDA